MDCSLPGSSVQGIFQARLLEWVAIAFSRGIFPGIPWESNQGIEPGGQTRVRIVGRCFTVSLWAKGEIVAWCFEGWVDNYQIVPFRLIFLVVNMF